MKNIDELQKLLDIRMNGDPNKYYEVTLWQNMVDIICSDMKKAISFINNDCSDEELYWLGEIYNDVMEESHSREFIDCLQKRAEQVKNPEWKKEILADIHDAAEYVK